MADHFSLSRSIPSPFFRKVSKIKRRDLEHRSTPDFGMAPAIKFLILACALLAVTMAAESDNSDGQQSGRSRVSDEQLNIALSDKRYLTRQLKCALGEAPCDPVGRRLKSLVPLVLRGSCPQCSPEETRQIKKVLSHIQRSFPKEWNRIVQQYAGVS